MATVASYLLKRKLRGQRRYPLVLMLEPLYRCNLACAGCGKVQYPSHILKRQLSVEQCMRAVDECPAPIVSIPGGEPLLHPEIDRIVAGLLERKKYIYLCTNALLLEKKLDLFSPSRFLSFSVHLDGLEEEHDLSVCKKGTYDQAVRGIRLALERGFRVTTNTTLFDDASPERSRRFFDEMMQLGVEGMTISPGYAYAVAPDQGRFLGRERTRALFRKIFEGGGTTRWRFNQSPLFLEFLTGAREYDCTPWGNPTYGVFGWQRPCYLLQEGYAESFGDLIENTEWDRYGHASGNPRCSRCMVHSGFEASAVDEAFSSFSGMREMLRASLLGPRLAPAADAAGSPAKVLAAVPGQSRGFETDCSSGMLRKALEYRGDVSLALDDGSCAEGFVSNLRAGQLELWQKGEASPRRIDLERIRGVEFTGRDAASGEHWVRWRRRTQRRKGAGDATSPF
jgi:hopanoid biosynthesis associated radical SAM protein HpnH